MKNIVIKSNKFAKMANNLEQQYSELEKYIANIETRMGTLQDLKY